MTWRPDGTGWSATERPPERRRCRRSRPRRRQARGPGAGMAEHVPGETAVERMGRRMLTSEDSRPRRRRPAPRPTAQLRLRPGQRDAVAHEDDRPLRRRPAISAALAMRRFRTHPGRAAPRWHDRLVVRRVKDVLRQRHEDRARRRGGGDLEAAADQPQETSMDGDPAPTWSPAGRSPPDRPPSGLRARRRQRPTSPAITSSGVRRRRAW